MANRKYTTLPWTEYTVANGNYSATAPKIDRIVMHSTGGSYFSAISWFGNPAAKVSAHYVISNTGALAAMLEEYYTAFHSGSGSMNARSIGIEHEGYTGLVRSDAEYETSAKLVADICKYYKIPIDRQHILKHNEVVSTSCPTDLNVDRIIARAQQINAPIIYTVREQKIVNEVKSGNSDGDKVAHIKTILGL